MQRKRLQASLVMQQILSGFLANAHLPLVSLQSHVSANNKGDNEMIPFVNAVLTCHRLKCGPLLPNEIGRTAPLEGKRKK